MTDWTDAHLEHCIGVVLDRVDAVSILGVSEILDVLIESGLMWVCDECEGMNQLTSKTNCADCGAKREES